MILRPFMPSDLPEQLVDAIRFPFPQITFFLFFCCAHNTCAQTKPAWPGPSGQAGPSKPKKQTKNPGAHCTRALMDWTLQPSRPANAQQKASNPCAHCTCAPKTRGLDWLVKQAHQRPTSGRNHAPIVHAPQRSTYSPPRLGDCQYIPPRLACWKILLHKHRLRLKCRPLCKSNSCSMNTC